MLRGLQGLLARIYDAPAAHDVHDFLVTDALHAAGAGRTRAAAVHRRAALLAEGADGLELSLYVDAEVLRRLATRCPLHALDERNLADYCTALEGVSHFHYVVWNADSTREISLLELELQAEVDKYASALSLLLAQREGRFPAELFHRLFEGVRFCRNSPRRNAPVTRKHIATRLVSAAGWKSAFCVLGGPGEALLAELRRFYRLGASQSCATRRSGPEPRLALAGLISHALLERDPLAELAQVALLLP